LTFLIQDNTTVSVNATVVPQTIIARKTDDCKQTCDIDVGELPISLMLVNNPYNGGQNDKVHGRGLFEIFDIKRFEICVAHNVNFIGEIQLNEMQIVSMQIIRFTEVFWMYNDSDNAWYFELELPALITIHNLE
jgi:hypothetical protein